MDVGSTLVANREPTELIEPGQRALDDPAMASESLARIDALPRDPDVDAASAEKAPTARDVIRLISMELVGTFASLAAGPRD